MRRHCRCILIIFGLFFALPAPGARAQDPAQAEATLNVPVFPKGRLSAEQLAPVAEAIRRLEANPLASDGMEARRNLLMWLADSPDVTVRVCEHVWPASAQSSETSGITMTQFFFSSAAFIIEHPDQARDPVTVNLAGLQGALRTYELLKARRGNAAKTRDLERLLEKRERSELEAYVRAGLARC
jgi:hypothetical protein